MAWFSRISRKVLAMIAGGALLIALGYLLPHAQPNHTTNQVALQERAYKKWVNGFAGGLGNRPAVVILEPDALAQLDSCMNNIQRQARLQMLAYAVRTLQTKKDQVYLDAGHANWVPASQMAARLRAADIAQAYGFSLNVSNFDPTTSELGYATELNQELGMAKRFVIDTSRNGKGSRGRAHLAADPMSGALPGAGQGALASQLFTDPNTEAADWARANPGDPRAKAIQQHIADQPTAQWFGAWSGDITAAVSGYTISAASQGKVPILVAYDIPNLDCGSTSSTSGPKTWCNPPGHQLGAVPQVLDDRGDMGLWIKAPGESDGDCGAGAGTQAGEFSPALASELISGRR